MNETAKEASDGRTEQTRLISNQVVGGLILAALLGAASAFVGVKVSDAQTEIRLTNVERKTESLGVITEKLRDDVRDVKGDVNQIRWIVEGKQGAKK